MTAAVVALSIAAADPVRQGDPKPVCGTCKDRGFVTRPKETKKISVTRHAYGPGWRLEAVKETEVVDLGGIDACPDCAARAEASFQTGKGKP